MTCICKWRYIYVHIYIHMYSHTEIHTYTNIHIHIHICTSLNMRIYMHLHMYIHIYSFIHKHVYKHIHIHHTGVLPHYQDTGYPPPPPQLSSTAFASMLCLFPTLFLFLFLSQAFSLYLSHSLRAVPALPLSSCVCLSLSPYLAVAKDLAPLSDTSDTDIHMCAHTRTYTHIHTYTSHAALIYLCHMCVCVRV